MGEIVQGDPFTFHVRRSAYPDGQVILSVRTSEGEPERIVCVEVGG